MIGQRLSHFEITAKLGEGGMGAVYRARDTKLDREVAIKVLPEEFTSDPERLARFEREAKLLAALNHPNIAGIYEVGEADDVHFLAMELAEGEDLAERLGRGPMEVDEALSAALQIATALEAAHDRGVVHRDLKPANIKLAAGGSSGVTVKVLDFGLAKAWAGPGGTSSQMTNSPTLTAQMTQAGVILGTAGYMSPEQARAQEADRRSDIWSFGVVVYEMLTGQKLFAANTVSDTLARVLTFDPDWDELDVDLPGPLTDLLERCLDRDVSQRLQAIGEARIAILKIQAGDYETRAVAETEAPGSGGSGRLPWLFAGLATAAAIALGVFGLGTFGPGRGGQPLPLLQAEINAPRGVSLGAGRGISISPDGKYVVIIGSSSAQDAAWQTNDDRNANTMPLWLRPVDSVDMRPIPGTNGATYPFWSPDSRHLAFFANNKLKRVDLQGSPPLSIADVLDARGGTWNRDDVIVYAPDFRGGLMRIPAGGGTPQPVAELDHERGENSLRWPWFLPDGKHLLFLSQTAEGGAGGDTSTIETLELATGERNVVIENNSSMAYDGVGHLLFWRGGALLAQSFDASSRQLNGEVAPLVEGIGYTQNELALFGVSETGTLVYQIGQRGGSSAPLAWYNRQGERLAQAGPAEDYRNMTLSPDGRQLAYTRLNGLWVLDLVRGTASKISSEHGDFQTPIWSPDGEWIAYRTNREGPSEIRRLPSSGLGDEEELWRGDQVVDLEDWSADGRRLLVSIQSGTSAWDTSILSLETGELASVASSLAMEVESRFSPDDRWVAYNSDESGTWEIYMVPTSGQGRRIQLTVNGGEFPYFHPDGREVVFTRSDGLLYSVELGADAGTGRMEAGIPEPLFDIGYISSDNRWHLLSEDGERILVREFQTGDLQLPLHLVQNWPAILERRR